MVRSYRRFDRSGSVSSTRRTNSPPARRANRKFATAVSALPRWSAPVGEGAKRTRTPATVAGYGSRLAAPDVVGRDERELHARKLRRDGRNRSEGRRHQAVTDVGAGALHRHLDQ